jgi:hypothetical protein
MRAPLISSSFFCLTVLTAGALRAASLEIQNAGFEAGGWLVWSAANSDPHAIAVIPEAARTGRLGLRVTGTEGVICGRVSPRLPAAPGTCYALSFWGRSQKGSPVAVYTQYFDGGGRELTGVDKIGEFYESVSDRAKDWHMYTLYSQAPANTATLGIWIYSGRAAKGSADLDDFSLVELSDEEAEKRRPQIFYQTRNGRVPVPAPGRATPAPTAPTGGLTPLAEADLRRLFAVETVWAQPETIEDRSIYSFKPDGTASDYWKGRLKHGENPSVAGTWAIARDATDGLVVEVTLQTRQVHRLAVYRTVEGKLVLKRKSPASGRTWPLVSPVQDPLADTPAPKAVAVPPVAAPPEKPARTDEQLAAECAQLKSAWGIYKSNSENIRNESQPKFDALLQQYRRSLEALKNTVQSRGDLVKTKAAVAETERFERMKSLPPEQDEGEIEEIKALQSAYVKQFTALEKEMLSRLGLLTQQYEQALGRLQAERVKAGKLDEATAVSEARERAKRTVTDLAEQLAASSPASAAPAAEPAAEAESGKAPAQTGEQTGVELYGDSHELGALFNTGELEEELQRVALGMRIAEMPGKKGKRRQNSPFFGSQWKRFDGIGKPWPTVAFDKDGSFMGYASGSPPHKFSDWWVVNDRVVASAGYHAHVLYAGDCFFSMNGMAIMNPHCKNSVRENVPETVSLLASRAWEGVDNGWDTAYLFKRDGTFVSRRTRRGPEEALPEHTGRWVSASHVVWVQFDDEKEQSERAFNFFLLSLDKTLLMTAKFVVFRRQGTAAPKGGKITVYGVPLLFNNRP